jgi:hypothetical protein
MIRIVDESHEYMRLLTMQSRKIKYSMCIAAVMSIIKRLKPNLVIVSWNKAFF